MAPYQIYLISIGVNDEADKLYEELKAEGFEVLYDDRKDNPGVKFKDADLIGIPLRIVISNRTMENDSVEWKLRSESDAEMVKTADLNKKISEFLNN